MPDPISLTISALALATSIVTAWLALLRHGTVRMTQPTVVYFGPDGRTDDRRQPSPKVYLRTLLYCTSKRGRIIESLYLRLRRGETAQTFNIWVHGDEGLSRGSGLYVGQEGVAANHHFLLPEDGTSYSFLAGQYRLELFASITGVRRPALLCATELQVSESVAAALKKPDTGVYFDWGPDSARYHPHVRASARPALPPGMIAVLGSSEAFRVGLESELQPESGEPSQNKTQERESTPNQAAGADG